MYDAERANALIRPNSAATIIKPTSHQRTQTISQSSIGPGAYDASIKFGEKVKTFTIAEKRPSKIPDSVGPGAYEPTRAESLTRSRSPTTKFS